MITEEDFKDALLRKNKENSVRSIDFTGWDAYEAILELLDQYKREAYSIGYAVGYDDSTQTMSTMYRKIN